MESSPHPALLQFTNIHEASHNLSQSSSIFHVPIPQKRHWHCVKLGPSPNIFRAWSKSISGQPSSMAHHPILCSHSFFLQYWCCSVSQSCPTLCDPMDWSTPGFPVPHHLPECAQVHVHCISDAILPSHPLTHSSSAPFPVSEIPTKKKPCRSVILLECDPSNTTAGADPWVAFLLFSH